MLSLSDKFLRFVKIRWHALVDRHLRLSTFRKITSSFSLVAKHFSAILYCRPVVTVTDRTPVFFSKTTATFITYITLKGGKLPHRLFKRPIPTSSSHFSVIWEKYVFISSVSLNKSYIICLVLQNCCSNSFAISDLLKRSVGEQPILPRSVDANNKNAIGYRKNATWSDFSAKLHFPKKLNRWPVRQIIIFSSWLHVTKCELTSLKCVHERCDVLWRS